MNSVHDFRSVKLITTQGRRSVECISTEYKVWVINDSFACGKYILVIRTHVEGILISVLANVGNIRDADGLTIDGERSKFGKSGNISERIPKILLKITPVPCLLLILDLQEEVFVKVKVEQQLLGRKRVGLKAVVQCVREGTEMSKLLLEKDVLCVMLTLLIVFMVEKSSRNACSLDSPTN